MMQKVGGALVRRWAAGLLMAGMSSGIAYAEPAITSGVGVDRYGDMVFTNAPDGQGIFGRVDALKGALERNQPVAVSWMTWHGIVTGTCQALTPQPEGDLQCLVEVWCNHPDPDVPAEHGHRARVDTGGRTSSMIMVKGVDQERRIFAVESHRSGADWYVKGRTAASE